MRRGADGGYALYLFSPQIDPIVMKSGKQTRWVGGRCRGDVAAWRERDCTHQKKLRQKSGGSQTRKDWISSVLWNPPAGEGDGRPSPDMTARLNDQNQTKDNGHEDRRKLLRTMTT